MIEIPEPVTVVRDQKTMNGAFGTIQHFLDFIMKRTPEAYGLYQRLKNLKLESQSHEFEDIIKEVITCIQKGAEVRERIVQTRSASLKTNFLIEAKGIVDLIKSNTQTLGDFFKGILKAYTMESFICYWLNELLRSENWEEINVLTPYLVCLVYTFKLSEYIIKYEEPQGFMTSLFAIVRKQKLYLYRGTSLTREHLELYDQKKIKYFSWNGVTSSSKEKSVALKFIELSLNKVNNLNESKVGVLFKIETNFASSQDCEGMIDIATNSRYPEEKEIILAPGTVFKLQKIRLVENNIYEVNLLVKKKFEETKENIALLGTLQDEAILKDKAIIDGLPSQQSFRLVELLKGNKLIRKIEVRNSGIEEHIMEEIENLRATTNVRKEDVILRNNTVVVSSLGLLAHYFSAESLNDLLMFNKIRFKDGENSKDVEIKTLILSEECLERFKQNNQLKELGSKIASANQIEHFDLAVPKLESSNCEWIMFLQCIRELKGLQSLRLKRAQTLDWKDLEILCQTIESSKALNRLYLELSFFDEEFELLKKALESMESIKNFSLALRFYDKISDQGINHLKDGLLSLSSLQHLSLNFYGGSNISDEGLNHLKSGLLSLSSLQYLSLDFRFCYKISDEGLNHLKNGLLSLSSLQHLSLNFHECSNISDEGLNHLKSGFLSLSSLQHLSLAFNNCNKISDEGLNNLKSDFLSLSSLQQLSLNFYGCSNISDEGLNHLKNGLLSLSSLQHLSLNFRYCNEISDEGLNHLKNGLLSLSSLQHLSLNFHECSNISDEGLNHLKSGLISLSSLQHLSLNFYNCVQISDEGLNHLKSGLLSLSSLQHLSLDFSSCDEISNKGLNHFKSGLHSFSSLQHLSLDFSKCNQISDEGLNHLKSGLLSLSSLQHLSLNFSWCEHILDEGLNHLKSGLLSLSSLQHLSLDFSYCDKISNKGLNHLKSGLHSFSSLQYLSLNFIFCREISDEGLNHLKSGLISLSSLLHLYLNFEKCNKISDERLNNLRTELKLIPSISISK